MPPFEPQDAPVPGERGWQKTFADMRQSMLFPENFRIPAADWPEPPGDVADPTHPPPADERLRTVVDELMKLAADVASKLWRAHERFQERGEEDDPRLRSIARNVESSLDAFANAGFEIRGHTGERYVLGSALKVIAYPEKAGVTFEVVDETIKPSIFFRDEPVQHGEVIVAIPEKTPGIPEATTPEHPEPTKKSEANAPHEPQNTVDHHAAGDGKPAAGGDTKQADGEHPENPDEPPSQ